MDRRALIESILGYLDLSDGTPSPSFQQAINDFYRQWEAEQTEDSSPPWLELRAELSRTADATQRFGELRQARAVIALVHDSLFPAYRQYHRDLLAHLSEEDLFLPFFLARCYETVLSLGEPWDDVDRIVVGAIDRLNDFVGHRPIPVLENQRGVQTYPHERVRPVPLVLRGAGISVGKYASLLSRTLKILESASPEILESASMDLSLMDELAYDPRAYDHSHPVNQRPGYQFGEWDPHHIDNHGRFRRFVLRKMILDALLHWVNDPENEERAYEAEFEAAAALAGTMLLASGISGRGPGAFQSEMTLAKLVPSVAAYRDSFYSQLISHVEGVHGEYLRAEAERLHQPFGGVRSFLNQYVAQCRARQIERDRLSLLFARMGYPEASQDQAARIDITSTRMRAQIECSLVAARTEASAGHVGAAAERLREAEDLLHRAIECGAMVDPWNILGFQGNFSRFQSAEDAVVDQRVDILLRSMQELFDTYAMALRESAAGGHTRVSEGLEESLESLVIWWDQFATDEVSGVRRVSGRESLQSARFVAHALSEWQEGGERTGDVAFWRERSEHFSSTQSFGLVVSALLEKGDYVSSMALLMQWLSENESCPLDESGHSFHELVIRWLAGMMRHAIDGESVLARPGGAEQDPRAMIVKFFDFFEANAGVLWNVPSLDDAEILSDVDDEEEDLFAAAYEGVTYEDETDDGVDAPLAGDGLPDDEGIWALSEELMSRLRFIGTVARLWYLAAHPALVETGPGENRLASWIDHARKNRRELAALLHSLESEAIEAPEGTRDSLLEFERQTSLKEGLLNKAMYVTIETSHALRALLTVVDQPDAVKDCPPWEAAVIAFESAVRHGDVGAARARLADVRHSLVEAPLMYVPTDKGGTPLTVCTARYARDVLRSLAVQLPSIGDFQGAYDLLESVLDIEHEQSSRATTMQVSEFDLLFRMGYRSLMVRLVELLSSWEETRDENQQSTFIIGQVVAHFSELWSRYIANVRISELERRRNQREWKRTTEFIKRYGRDLFTQGFMTEGSLRGIVHHGALEYLTDFIAEVGNDETLLAEEIRTGKISLERSADEIDFIARSILENYDSYRDYNTTTPQSDYGDNLHQLFALLRHKAEYDRHRWALEPAYIAHNVLVRHGRFEWAELLRLAFMRETRFTADAMLTQLDETEREGGFRLQTIRSRLAEGFIGQLDLDEVLGLAERCAGGAHEEESPGDSLAALLQDIDDLCEQNQGSGIDVPDWLRQLETAVDHVLDARDGRLQDFEELSTSRLHPVDLPYTDFKQQIEDWGEHEEK